MFNHLLVSPHRWRRSLLLIVLPLIVMTVFERSERATREWVGAGLDLDLELLQLVLSEHFQMTRLGGYLRELPSAFRGARRRRHVLPAAAGAGARRAGQGAHHGARTPGSKCRSTTTCTRRSTSASSCRKSIGPTGLLALKPLQVTSHRDDWHRYLLKQADVRAQIRDRQARVQAQIKEQQARIRERLRPQKRG